MPDQLRGVEYSVTEFRVEGDAVIAFHWRDAFDRRKAIGELDGRERTVYCRPMGEVAWGWHSGPFGMDQQARESHGVKR